MMEDDVYRGNFTVYTEEKYEMTSEKKSIREYNTKGMSLYERFKLYEKVIPIQIGETVWDSGDCWSYPELIKVTKDNQKEVTMFWNELFFDNEESAIRKNGESRMDYSYWMYDSWR